jgi:uncharacterized membrane protein YkvA (DUF1232 family)
VKREAFALYLACGDPRTPWGARVLAGVVVAYAFSPIDLIPDFIPILGYLDDLVLVPLGILAVRRLVPAAVMAECRVRAETELLAKPVSRRAAVVIVLLWLLAAAWVGWAVWRWVRT